MIDFSKLETWFILIAIIISTFVSLFVFIQDKQDVKVLEKLTVDEQEVIVVYIANNLNEAEKVLLVEYPASDWIITERYFDNKSKKAIFRLKKKG